jgi:hypothetical protein
MSDVQKVSNYINVPSAQSFKPHMVWSWPHLRHCHSICVEGLEKTTEARIRDSWRPSRDLIWASSSYRSEELLLERPCSVRTTW